MRRFYIIGFLCLMAFDTLAQISFKYAGMAAAPLEFSPAWMIRVMSSPWSYGAICGYFCSFVTWMTLLEHAPIGPAFAASHLEVVSVLALSVVVFGEHVGAPQLIGSVLIIAGIVCLAISETEGESAPAAH